MRISRRALVSNLLVVPTATAIFLENLDELAYHEDTDLSGDALAFHVQHNAGILADYTAPLRAWCGHTATL